MAGALYGRSAGALYGRSVIWQELHMASAIGRSVIWQERYMASAIGRSVIWQEPPSYMPLICPASLVRERPSGRSDLHLIDLTSDPVTTIAIGSSSEMSESDSVVAMPSPPDRAARNCARQVGTSDELSKQAGRKRQIRQLCAVSSRRD